MKRSASTISREVQRNDGHFITAR
ncbi:MAG: hypothetical protein AAGF25_03110 [Pseudomonadota bacterium]